ncbi:MAG: hypothetical protein ACYSSO_06190 [Planctomycetota bacterium]|jgi:hypothetical protein
MDDIYSLSTVVLAHGPGISGNSAACVLILTSLFVFGPLLFRESFRVPKELFVSSFISYLLILVNILAFSLGPIEVAFVSFLVIYPYFLLVGFIEALMERLFGSGLHLMHDETIAIYLIAFIINTLAIFAIKRLFLYIRHKQLVKRAV